MKNNILFLSFTMIFSISGRINNAIALTITKESGCLETAYVTWSPVANAERYNVYYSGKGVSDKKIDSQLIREYPGYYRADVLGLKSGSYSIAVKAVDADNNEFESGTSSIIEVKPHTRERKLFISLLLP
jgi:ABC-type transport system involved in multi-copper enzyme maturation permease subunit